MHIFNAVSKGYSQFLRVDCTGDCIVALQVHLVASKVMFSQLPLTVVFACGSI